MLAFIIRRVMESFFVMILVAAIAFSMFRFAGDPVHQMVGPETSHEERMALREELGLNKPIWMQFVRYIYNAAMWDLGISYQHRRPVSDLVLERWPATIELSLVAVLLALVIGIPLGVYTGLNPDSWGSRLLLAGSLIGISLPTFLIGILMIYLFSVQLGWLPSFGRGEVVDLGFWTTGFLTASGLKALIMPALTLGLFQVTLILRLVRAEMVEVMATDFIRFARARGLPNRAIHYRHALTNSLMPVITIAGLQVGSLLAFAVITESVFQWPGLGLLFLQAIQAVDIPVMAGYLMLAAFMFVMLNLGVDLLYLILDPRIRDSAGGGVWHE